MNELFELFQSRERPHDNHGGQRDLLVDRSRRAEQGAATKAIARSVHEAASGTNQVSQNISGVTDATSETGHAAGLVLQSSGRTHSAFVDGVRAA
ncbi:hypothetical protein AYJ54_17570 [Bradyrhizobium centrolobii]|uniref:Uncharacterized protein n=1 Tax=Bradyrhizobium centrolobii TaxID=1505087 RepID=A0A176YKX7_9BRAD|nr:hypothetical protein [Bradyrhizobium centrolobii]OAF07664.1 hypothetical protein AYJ54_17570 [Bradyrhizobium centrolobii]